MTNFEEACEQLAKSVAEDVHHFAGKPCGYHAKVDEQKRRVQFTFRVGLADKDFKYSTPMLPIVDLKSAQSWQPIFEDLLKQVLKETSPLGYAQKLRQREETGQPEIPVFIDAKGKRHFTLKAETGYLEGILGKVGMNKEQSKRE